jgi:hypothetical protein
MWKPHGVLDEEVVNEMVVFIGTAEARSSKPFNRFIDLSALDAVDLNFKFVFDVALHRRLTYAGNPAVKSAFYVTSPTTVHYAKLHKLLNDYSPINVRLFTDREGGEMARHAPDAHDALLAGPVANNRPR